MRVINKKIVITILVILEICSIYLMYKSYNNKNLLEDKIEEPKKEKLAIKVDNGNGEYVYSTDLPGKGYELNKELTECLDIEGNKVNNPKITSDGESVTITSKYTNYCTLYFDEEENIRKICKGQTIKECLENKSVELETIRNLNPNQAGMYRYQGSREEVTNNYICFGTSEKETCLADQDKYMYRILGMTEDGNLKLIKNTPIKDGDTIVFKWHNTQYEKKAWNESDLYKRLNGIHKTMTNIFINSVEYPYMKENIWLNKIEDSDWYQGFMAGPGGFSPLKIYQIESGKSSVYSRELVDGVCQNSTAFFSLFRGAKIGLMNMTDYNYANQKDGINCYALSCDKNWLYNKNIIGNKFIEGLMTSYDCYNAGYPKYGIYYFSNNDTDGYIMDAGNTFFIIRPVFFLTSVVNIINGIGTINNPFIIKN